MLSAFQMVTTTLASSALGYRQVAISCHTVMESPGVEVNLSVLILLIASMYVLQCFC